MTVFYQRRSHDFFKGGHTVSNRGYSSDFRVDPHALFYIRPKKAYKRGAGGVHAHPGTPHPLASYALGCILLNTAELPNILLNTNIYFTLCKCKRNKVTKAPV